MKVINAIVKEFEVEIGKRVTKIIQEKLGELFFESENVIVGRCGTYKYVELGNIYDLIKGVFCSYSIIDNKLPKIILRVSNGIAREFGCFCLLCNSILPEPDLILLCKIKYQASIEPDPYLIVYEDELEELERLI